MRHLSYLAVLAGCLASALWLEPVLRVRVLRRWRRLLLTLVPVVVVFGAWDIAAIAAGHWWYDRGQLVGVTLPGRLPLEELLFFLVVPVCSILGFEAVRTVLARLSARAARGPAGPPGEPGREPGGPQGEPGTGEDPPGAGWDGPR
jgi:lycopene cyclase domain-containing protein